MTVEYKVVPKLNIKEHNVKLCTQCADNFVSVRDAELCACCQGVADWLATHCSRCKVEETKDNKLFESPDRVYKPWLCNKCLQLWEAFQ